MIRDGVWVMLGPSIGKRMAYSLVMRLPKQHRIHGLQGERVWIEPLSFPADKPVIIKECILDGVGGPVWVKALADGDYLFLFARAKVD